MSDQKDKTSLDETNDQQLATLDPQPGDPGNLTTKPKPIGAGETISEPESGTGIA
jgi:hypothetical protein